MTLTPAEYDTLTPEQRAQLNAAIASFPAERAAEFEVFYLTIRAIVSHETAGIHTTVRGVFELQDAADASARELSEAARDLRAVAAEVRTGLAVEIRERQQAQAALAARINRHAAWLTSLTAIVSIIVVETLSRYGPVPTAIGVVLLVAVFALIWLGGGGAP